MSIELCRLVRVDLVKDLLDLLPGQLLDVQLTEQVGELVDEEEAAAPRVGRLELLPQKVFVLLLDFDILGRGHQEPDRLDPDVARPDVVGHQVERLGSNPLVEDERKTPVRRSFRKFQLFRIFTALELLDPLLEGVEGVGGVAPPHLRDVGDVDGVQVPFFERLGGFQLCTCRKLSF